MRGATQVRLDRRQLQVGHHWLINVHQGSDDVELSASIGRCTEAPLRGSDASAACGPGHGPGELIVVKSAIASKRDQVDRERILDELVLPVAAPASGTASAHPCPSNFLKHLGCEV